MVHEQVPVVEELLELDDCKLAKVEETFPGLIPPRGSTLCSTARGVAATSPRREGRMMVERMAMRTCEYSSGEKPLPERVVVRSVGLVFLVFSFGLVVLVQTVEDSWTDGLGGC